MTAHFDLIDRIVADIDTQPLTAAYGLDLIEVGGRFFTISSSYEDFGLQVLEFDPATGELSAHSTFEPSGDDHALQGAGMVKPAKIDGVDYVFVSARDSGAVSMFLFDPTDGLTEVDVAVNGEDGKLERVFQLDVVRQNGDVFLLAGDGRSGSISTFQITDEGMTPLESLPDGSATPWGMATYQIDGKTFVYAGNQQYVEGSYDNALEVFELGDDGSLSAVASYEMPGDYESVTTGQFHGRDLLFFTNYSDATTVTFEISDDGTLERLASYTDTQGHWNLSEFDTVNIGGNTYLIGHDATTHSLQLLDVDAQGRLTLIDSIRSDFALDGVRDTAIVQSDEGLFILSSARDGDNAAAFELSGIGGEIIGSKRRDKLIGDETSEILDGGGGRDRLFGKDGNDILIGGAASDRLVGGRGDDMLRGDSGRDVLLGGAGDDTLSGSFGDKTLDGGRGHDLVDFSESDDAVSVKLAKLPDNMISIEGVIGTDHDDTLQGSKARNSLFGGQGDDVLSGGAKSDRLAGGNGADTLEGGSGRDLLWGGAGADVFVMRTETAQDRIKDFGWEDTIDLSGVQGVSSFHEDITITELDDFTVRVEAGDTLVFYVEGYNAPYIDEYYFIF